MIDVETVDIHLADSVAEALAEAAYDTDVIKGVPPSLLSASKIVEYVQKTAFINPFFASKDTLKHASYEGKLGEASAYIYDESGRVTLDRNDGYLRIKANSIVFVETEYMFRLPRYLAARFNLQIKHVHRGLLLGTGPLIDPGFRGRLLIPLHNLTSEDYYIHKDEGLIWLEFTRTTYKSKALEPYGDFPDRKRISDGAKWLDKAAYSEYLRRTVVIRSSIPTMVEGLTTSSEQATNSAAAASISATNADKKVTEISNKFKSYSIIGGLAAGVGILALWATFYIGVSTGDSALSARIDGIVGPNPARQAGSAASALDPNGTAIISELDLLKQRLVESEQKAAANELLTISLKAELERLSLKFAESGTLSPADVPLAPPEEASVAE